MLDPMDPMLTLAEEVATGDAAPVTANTHTCPTCGYVNWCVYSPGHSGVCLCDKGHIWPGLH